MVDGRPKSNLINDLGGYLEEYLNHPVGGYQELAERVLDKLRSWDENTFRRLFSAHVSEWDQTSDTGIDQPVFKITSNDPRILAWPWEALRCPQGYLGLSCHIIRQLHQQYGALPLPTSLPGDRINILLVIGYNLWLRGAQQFALHFYHQLFATGNLTEAMHAGHKAIQTSPNGSTESP